MLPNSLKNLIDKLSTLPSIGPRQATRLAFHMIRSGEHEMRGLADNLKSASDIKTCSKCFFIHDNAISECSICTNLSRDPGTIMVLEKETDLISVENTKKYNGHYLVLGEIPKAGLLQEWQKLRLKTLATDIDKNLGGVANEIILAINPTSTGDFHAGILKKELEPIAKKITRLGRGLPTGGEIEFADDETLSSALERRS